MCEYLEILKNIMAIFFYAVLSSAILVHLIDWWQKKNMEVLIPEVVEEPIRIKKRGTFVNTKM